MPSRNTMANAVVAISARRRTREIRVCGAGLTVKPVETKFEDKPMAMRIKVEFINPPRGCLTRNRTMSASLSGPELVLAKRLFHSGCSIRMGEEAATFGTFITNWPFRGSAAAFAIRSRCASGI